jgi:signal transduction histidine kinase
MQRPRPNRALALILVAMVVIPVGLFAFLGQRLIADQDALSRLEATRAFDDRLDALESAINTIVRGVERELARYAETLPDDAIELAEVLRRLPREVDVLVLGADARVLHPYPRGALSRREVALLDRTRRYWGTNGVLWQVARGLPVPGVNPGDDRGWLSPIIHGTQTFFRWYRKGTRTIFFEIGEVSLASELVMQLPDTPEAPGKPAQQAISRTVLLDATGATLYQWGLHEPHLQEAPRATRVLVQPLAGWRLQHYAPENALSAAYEGTLRVAVWGGLAGLAVILAGCAFLIWRARTRESRIAQQRISFVNQVSHELKTPLTNIRMYADLLANAIDDDDLDGLGDRDPKRRHLNVIVRESDRLSRLIRNVLNFARSQEERLTLSPRRGRLGDVVRAVLATHAESLRTLDMQVETDLTADPELDFDPDAVEQILTNLVSNVEKYARSGRYLGITLVPTTPGAPARMLVRDRGPGVAREHRERIFEPFWRASDKLSDGVAGTGIGLDIARRLARLHGGELRLLPQNEPGCLFELTLACPPPMADTAAKA